MSKRIWYILAASLVLLVGVGGFILTNAHTISTPPKETLSDHRTTKPIQGSTKKSQLENKKAYSVPKADKSSANYVASGHASKIGEYTISSQGNKAVLAAKSNVTQTISNGDLTYTVSKVTKYNNDPKTDEAVEMARLALNTRDIDGAYTTLTIKYTIENTGSKNLQTDGVSTVAYTDGSIVSPLNGLDNDASLAQTTLAAGDKKTTFAVVLVPKALAATVKSIQIEFASIANSSHQKVQKASDGLTVNF